MSWEGGGGGGGREGKGGVEGREVVRGERDPVQDMW